MLEPSVPGAIKAGLFGFGRSRNTGNFKKNKISTQSVETKMLGKQLCNKYNTLLCFFFRVKWCTHILSSVTM